jgi:hypothetical protein
VCCVFCADSGLCDGLVDGSEESYCVCLIVCDLETSKRDDLGLTLAVASQKIKIQVYSPLILSFKRPVLDGTNRILH